MEPKPYCTQNDGNCTSCSLVNYGRDCQNNPVDYAAFAASAMGKKGGSATTARKKSASAANLNAARAQGKVGGYPKGRPRNKRGAELYDLQKEYEDLKTQPDGELIGSFDDFVNDTVRQNSRQYPTLAEEHKKSGMIII